MPLDPAPLPSPPTDGPPDPARRRVLQSAAGLLAGGLVVLAGCGNRRTSDRDLTLVSAVDAEALAAGRRRGLAGRRRTVVVDPRTPIEFGDGHLPGAINIPFERLREQVDQLRAFDIVLVCGGAYGDPIALAASKTLIEIGLPDVRTLDGGLQAWKAEGFPVESAAD